MVLALGNLVGRLQNCKKEKNLPLAKQLLAYLQQHRLETHPVLGNYLVPMLVDCGTLTDAQQVFDKLVHRTEFCWRSIISGYINAGKALHAFEMYHKMQGDSIQPNSYTYVTLLKPCAKMKDVERGQGIHADIIKKGLEIDLFVGSAMVDMYGKCGSLREACHVLDRLPERDTVIWNALIAGYAEHGFGDEVLDCRKKMQLNHIAPNAVTFACTLKSCGIIKAFETGQEVHAEITNMGLDKELYVGNTLVDMYAKCNMLAEASKVFDQLPYHDTVSWAALISAYSEHGLHEEVLRCFKQMHVNGVHAEAVTLIHCLKACGILGASRIGREVHSEIRRLGLERDHFVCNTLVDMYGKCGSLSEAQLAFDELHIRDAVSWNALIAAYAEQGCDKEVLSCYEQMQMDGLSPDDVKLEPFGPLSLVGTGKRNTYTYLAVLKACTSLQNVQKGGEIHAEMIKKGFEEDIHMGSSIVDMYGKCGLLKEARHVFDRLPIRDTVLWTSLIARYAEQGLGEEAVSCFDQMQLEGACSDDLTFAYSLKACGRGKALETGHIIHSEITRRGLERVLCVSNGLVDMYAKCNSLVEAVHLFDGLPVRDAVSWAIIVSAYAEHGAEQDMLDCFKQAQKDGVSLDAITVVHCLKASSTTGALEAGQEIHAVIKKWGLEKDLLVANMLIDMYGKCGLLAAAREVFESLPVRDVVSWTAMIKAYGENHEGKLAVHCFEDMQRQGIKPDAITFTCLLFACSQASLVLKGREYFKMMVKDYSIEPTLDHCACMVNLLARAGQMDEAEKFVEGLQCLESKEKFLRSLLSACKIHGEVELGLRCFQQLVEVNQEDASAYSLMADIHASVGKWSNVTKLEETRNCAGAKKKPASVSIELNKKLYKFVVGDSQSTEVAGQLGNLTFHMKNEGHVPHLDLIYQHIFGEER